MKIIKKIIITVITIILGLILIFNIYNLISLKILKKDLPTINGYAILEVATGSMRPTLKEGDLIVINTKAQTYQPKDIITFYDINGAFVTHRLVSLDKKNMVTKGDNNNTEDEALPKSNIVGKYVFKISGLGTILASLRSPFVSLMIFVIGILICYLVSTDKFGNPIEEDAEFQEFIASKEEPKKENKFLSFINNLKAKFPKKKKPTKKKKKTKRVKKAKPKKNKKRKKKNKKK